MGKELAVDPVLLREEVKSKYRDVANNPSGEYHFHTGRPLAKRLGYDPALVDSMPDAAIESFAGVANPFSLRSLEQRERVVDAGSGGGFDCFVAAHQIGPQGQVVGVDMLPEMLEKSRKTAEIMGLKKLEFREGLLEEMPVENGWADVVVSNGVINLCADKKRVFSNYGGFCAPVEDCSSAISPTVSSAGECDTQYRPLDCLNCRWPSVRRLAGNAGRYRVTFKSVSRMTPSAKRGVKRRPGSSMFMDIHIPRS
jgi:arsenite methyltransferase